VNQIKKSRLKYVTAMLCAWIGLYGVAILAMYTAGCNEDTNSESSDEAVTAQIEPYTAIDAPEGTGITVQGEIVTSAPEVPQHVARIISYDEGEGLYRAGEYGAAAEVFSAYSAGRPENLWGHYMLGLSCWKSGDFAGASIALEAALAIDGDHLKSHINLARVHLAANRYSDAHRHALTAVSLAPQQAVSHRILGRTFHSLGMAEEAISAYRSALLIDGNDAWSLNNIGLILIEEERFQESLGPLARAIQLRDNVAVFRNNLGVALERTGRYKVAAEAYRAVLEIETGYSRAATSLARVEALADERGLAQWDLAIQAERFVAGLSPETPVVVNQELTEATPQ
jgi:Tfp pilus assembly protein PilF